MAPTAQPAQLRRTPPPRFRSVAFLLSLLATIALAFSASAHEATVAASQEEPTGEPDAAGQDDWAAATYRIWIPLLAANATLATQPPAPLQQLQNGSFDDGGGWTEEAPTAPGRPIIIYPQTEPGVPPVPSVPNVAWLGGTGKASVSRLYQSVTLPSTYDARLRYDYLIQSAESICGNDITEIIVNGSVVKSDFAMCNVPGSLLNIWREQGISLRPFRGQTITLEFRTTLIGDFNSSFFLDNVELCGTYGLLPANMRCSGRGWQEMGVNSAAGGGISNNPGGSAEPSFAAAADGRPWMAWDNGVENAGDTDREIYVKRWNGRVWTEAGSSSAAGGGISNNGADSLAPALAIAPDGTPWVTWHDFGSGNFEIYVRRFNGSAWEEVGAGSASGGGISNNPGESYGATLVFAPDGAGGATPYVAWTNRTGAASDIFVKRWNGTVWEEAGAGAASGGGISNNAGTSEFVTLAAAPNGTVYAAWSDDSGGDSEIYVRRFTGATWVPAGSGAASGQGISNNDQSSTTPALAIPADALPWVAWVDRSDGDTEVFVRRFDGTSWAEVGAGSASGGGISNNAAGSISAALAIGSDGRALVVWRDESSGIGQVYARRWDGTAWQQVASSATAGGVSATLRLSSAPAALIAPDGVPAVAWSASLGAGNTEIYVRRYNAE